MVKTPSTMLSIGTRAPEFDLPNAAGERHSLDEHPGAKGHLVMFICNHCPFVKHLRSALADFGRAYQARGLAIYAISSNDVTSHPEDAPEKMAEEARRVGYTFPYLYDESQEVAKAYKAACTPDFFLFDQDRRLVYRGQFDDSRPGNGRPVTGSDLRAAADALLEGRKVSSQQRPSVGCNIKWKPGNEPDYFAA
ncbi:MAG TPA: thioredoxin family protein [Thermoanaerobaculia bacterium]|nr:thioredoxin family protein [Thermoanaerobaculia bacterium]